MATVLRPIVKCENRHLPACWHWRGVLRASLAALALAKELPAARPSSPMPRRDCAPRGRGAIEARYEDDGVSAAIPVDGLSDRASRQMFEGLVALGAARELTRPR